MNLKLIKTEEEHQKAVGRSMEIFHAEQGTPEEAKIKGHQFVQSSDLIEVIQMSLWLRMCGTE
jgi:hypothetical protein